MSKTEQLKLVEAQMDDIQRRIKARDFANFNDEMKAREYWKELFEIKEKIINRQGFLQKIDPNSIIKGGVTIGCLLAILRFEKVDTIVSKGFNIFTKTL